MNANRIFSLVYLLFVIVFAINYILGDKTLNTGDWILGVAFGVSVIKLLDNFIDRKKGAR